MGELLDWRRCVETVSSISISICISIRIRTRLVCRVQTGDPQKVLVNFVRDIEEQFAGPGRVCCDDL